MAASCNTNTKTWKLKSGTDTRTLSSCDGVDHVKKQDGNSKELLNINVTMQHNGKNGLILSKEDKKTEKNEPLKTFRLPPSSILSQVKDFLPKMEKANNDLQARLQQVPASELDIEHVTGDEGCVIEMNVAVVEQDKDYDSSEDSDSSVDLSPEVNEDNFKISKRTNKLRPNIEEISLQHDQSQGDKT